MKNILVADLKARLSECLRRVRDGETLTVLNRDTPVARIVPYVKAGDGLAFRKPMAGAPRPGKVPLPPPLKLEVDIVDLLLEERQVQR